MTPPENQIRTLPFTRRSAEEFLAARGREEYSQSSLHRYRCDLLQLERYLHGEPIGPDTLRAWRRTCARVPMRRAPSSPA